MSELATLINYGREARNLEFKRTMNWSDASTKAKVVKGSMAMANLRGGGTIVFGIDRQGDDSYVVVGMKGEDCDSFKQDDVSAEVNNYADPFVEIVIHRVDLDDKRFVVIQVREFHDVPIMCKRDGADRLRSGAIYTRSGRIHETTEVRSQIDLREILELAVEKKLRSLYSQIERAGAKLAFPEDRDAKAFDEQLGEL